MNPQEIAVATGVTMSIVQIIKMTIPELPVRFHPIMSVVFGALVGFAYKADPMTCLMIGLIASGTYSGVKAVIKNE